MLCFGDSVMWGQGLLPVEKFNAKVFEALAGSPPQADELQSFAHSGAIIGAGDDTVKPAIDPEVPDSYPTIYQQIAAYEGDTDVDLILINGSINDVGAMTIVSPLTDADDLRRSIRQHCYQDMKDLMVLLTSQFDSPKTRFVLVGYYPILSEQSDVDLIPRALGLRGVDLSHLVHVIDEFIYKKVFENCKLFSDLSAQYFQQVIQEVNDNEGDSRVRFAVVPFAPENSELAPNAWLFGLNADLSPQDPIQAARADMCRRDEDDELRLEACYHASLGHPNPYGASKFADTILKALE